MCKHRRDILAVGALLLAGLLLCLCLFFGKAKGAEVIVRVDGEIVARYDLAADGDYEILSADGGANLLIISGGTARVSAANCPDHVCVRTGRISRDGQSIVCLPHKLSIEISGGEAADYDALAG